MNPGFRIRRSSLTILCAMLGIGAACASEEAASDELTLPVLLTTDLPFAYPPDLYEQRIEGEVGLHLYVDSLGLVVPESTRVVEPSAHAAFDSSAVAGAIFLSFRPAERSGSRVGHTVVLPVQFRVPRDSTAADTSRPK
jgi:TonB family protein